jgi:hypothetical protein
VTSPLWRTSAVASRAPGMSRCPPMRMAAASASAFSRACRRTTASACALSRPARRPCNDDDGATTAQMGRGALCVDVNGTAVDLVTCHLKSKLLSYPRNRFNPRDERERARYAGYALALRAAEAITLRHYATGLRDGQGRQRALIVLGDLNDEPLAATTKILLGPPGSEIDTRGFELTMPATGSGVEPRAPHRAGGSPVQPRVLRSPGAHRSHPRQPCAGPRFRLR